VADTDISAGAETVCLPNLIAAAAARDSSPRSCAGGAGARRHGNVELHSERTSVLRHRIVKEGPMAVTIPYTKGVHEVADGVWAYLQPDGGWGRSNAGLVAGAGGDGSLLVDTLFDLRMTADMLDALRRATPAAERITTVVNTHANGDHCYGNALVADAEIIASAATTAEMDELPAATLAAFMQAAPDLGVAGEYLLDIFGDYQFEGIEHVPATRTFSGQLELTVGDRAVRLIEVGPAHTGGDVIVHVPDVGVVFTGDIVFNGGHPIVWAGPVDNWIAACDRVLALEGVDVVVPGHGPVTDLSAVAALRDYFGYLTAEARTRFDAGMSPFEAARDIDLGPYAQLSERERLAANVNALYHDFGGDVAVDAVTVITLMAEARRDGLA
jgi:glyoxylase-like metal-dependent hydrolase (beta-lactamase superfamily II)